MSNFAIHFDHPWLLLLLIPAIAFTVIPYFRLARKYRRTRNRIMSMVLHSLIMLFAVSVLAGISFSYEKPNEENEVILLVDVSYSGHNTEETRNQFVKSVLDKSGDVKVGVVIFGYGQSYVSQFGETPTAAYNHYLTAPRPNETATDIASALSYARTLFTNPQAAKIVLVTDGMETDNKALSTIKSIAADGIRVDSVFLPTEVGDEVQIIDVETPETAVGVATPFSVTVTLQSSVTGKASITMYDNDVQAVMTEFNLARGLQTVEIEHTFTTPGVDGLHRLYFSLDGDRDTLEQNNGYHTYIKLASNNEILIIERYNGESDVLKEVLENDQNEYTPVVANVQTGTNMPTSLDELRYYDQVILVNISNEDLTSGFVNGFDKILHSYVYDIGGGLFTVGGNDPDRSTATDPVAHAYNRDDMYGSLFQQMLPVNAINYTPPVGLMIIIDRSASMGGAGNAETGKTCLDLAKDGAISCLNALNIDRDYVGIMTLESDYNENIQMTPMTRAQEVREVIDRIGMGGGTVYTGAIDRAGAALKALDRVQRKHVILVTDGEPSDGLTSFGPIIKDYYENWDITFTTIGVNSNSMGAALLKQMADLGGGNFFNLSDFDPSADGKTFELPRVMREELMQPEIREVVYEDFTPTISSYTAVVSGVEQSDMPILKGFYGTKAKEKAKVSLMGEFLIPIYAQWTYGRGTVGSFMCDLKGSADSWSADFLADDAGKRIIHNIVGGLFPTDDIRPKDVYVELYEDNYNTQMSVYTDLQEGERVEITITGPIQTGILAQVQTFTLDTVDGMSRINFTIMQPGIYEVVVRKFGADGTMGPGGEYKTYKKFSYSAEYDLFEDEAACLDFLLALTTGGRGFVIDSVQQVFEGFSPTIKIAYDPRLPLIIAAIVLFLLDVAVRKFKFKWIHEIVRDRKAKKAMRGENNAQGA